MDANDKICRIVCMCSEADKIAERAYRELAALASSRELREFWEGMSREEASHVAFWDRACELGREAGLPNVFDDPDAVVAEVEGIIPKAEDLLARCHRVNSVADAFSLAYRLEFYLLRPSFETLFQVLRHVVDGPCPEDEYENHINGFVTMLARHGDVTPELEMFGEMLQRLWNESRALAERAAHDPLTGLLTRQAFMEIAVRLAFLAQRRETPVGVMMLDIDHFKRINDEQGHAAGDRTLKRVARLVQSGLRAADVVARYGGDEFVVFMPDAREDAAPEIAERIRASVSAAKPDGAAVTLSVGLVTALVKQTPEATTRNLVETADDCLYRAKNTGRNRAVMDRLP